MSFHHVRAALVLLALIAVVPGTAHAAEPCCGPISEEGHRLEAVLDGMNVESLWLAHEHVNWLTGEPDRHADYEGPGRATHCSAFAAAVGQRLGIYMLRPPEHGQVLLASAQAVWFRSAEGQSEGWHPVADPREAQAFANQGNLVVVVFENPDLHRPGHVAVVRPSLKTVDKLAENGPQTIQAGTHNFRSTNVREGFRGHPGAWPNGVRYYMHPLGG